MFMCVQGLNDTEEFVITEALHALKQLTEHRLLNKNMMQILVCDAMPLLAHPVGVICAVCHQCVFFCYVSSVCICVVCLVCHQFSLLLLCCNQLVYV